MTIFKEQMNMRGLSLSQFDDYYNKQETAF